MGFEGNIGTLWAKGWALMLTVQRPWVSGKYREWKDGGYYFLFKDTGIGLLVTLCHSVKEDY